MQLAYPRHRQSNGRSFPLGATSPSSSDNSGREGTPFGQCGRASLLVGLAGHEMSLLIEKIVDLGVDRAELSRFETEAWLALVPANKFRRLENRHWRPGAQNRLDRPGSVGLQSPRPQTPAEYGALRHMRRSPQIQRMRGWGGRIRPSVWRNQNAPPADRLTRDGMK
jgi:hypothetical protein